MNDLAKTAEIWGVEAGYHDVFGNWHTADPQTISRLIAGLSRGREGPALLAAQPVEPLRAFQGDGRRDWALAVQLYAIRSARNWGHGDFSDLAAAGGDCGRTRRAPASGSIRCTRCLPIVPSEASPYAPNSRLFLNPLYIDVEAIPEFPGSCGSRACRRTSTALRATDIVDYTGVAAAKLAGLRLAHQTLSRRGERDAPRRFRSLSARAGRGACCGLPALKCLRQRHAPKPWPEWPRAVAHVRARGAAEDFAGRIVEDCEFHEYMQWVADRQLAACKHAARDRACRSVFISTSRSASIRTAPTPGASRTPC